MSLAIAERSLASRSLRSGEQGWALLGLLLALSVMSIFLVSSIVPDVQKQVQREKEAEMLYRGQQMAEGIARYYSNGQLQPLRLVSLHQSPGPLPELEKLRDGVTIGAIEKKFVRPSAMIDPVSSDAWEPVREQDPRILKFLHAWELATGIIITPDPTDIRKEYLLIAGLRPIDPNNSNTDPPNDTPDTLGHSNRAIVGVAPKKKGKAMNNYFGLDNYEDWVFIYIPKNLVRP